MHTAGDINQWIRIPPGDVGFPDAPPGWSAEDAREVADTDGLYLSEAHWDVVRALQGISHGTRPWQPSTCANCTTRSTSASTRSGGFASSTSCSRAVRWLRDAGSPA